jgi:hypothetical protein
VNNEHWSWCEYKLDRLRFKRSLADAAVDGVIPEGYLVGPEQVCKAALEWLERIGGDAQQ